MVLSRAWRRVKKFLGSWQRAGRLDKRHQRSLNQRMWGDMKRGRFFHSGKRRWQKKDGEQYGSSDGIKHFSVRFLKLRKCHFKSELNYNDEIWGKDMQEKVHCIRWDFIDWTLICGTDCICPFNWTLSQFIEWPFREAIRPEIVIRITTAWRSIETRSVNKLSCLLDSAPRSLWPSSSLPPPPERDCQASAGLP